MAELPYTRGHSRFEEAVDTREPGRPPGKSPRERHLEEVVLHLASQVTNLQRTLNYTDAEASQFRAQSNHLWRLLNRVRQDVLSLPIEHLRVGYKVGTEDHADTPAMVRGALEELYQKPPRRGRKKEG